MTFEEWMNAHMQEHGDSLSYTPKARLVWEAATKAEREAHAEMLTDHKRLVRELDVLINGIDGAAQQASLCDIVSQLRAAIGG